MDYKMSRLRYFNGQFLLEKDFSDQQSYHVNQTNLHDRMMHVWGITEGLSVASKVGEPTKVTVQPGAAIDKSGNLILLDQSKDANGQDTLGGQTYYLVIAFNEVADTMAAGQYVSGNTRFTQKPLLQFVALPDLVPGQVVLASLDVAIGGGISNIDARVRTYAGVRLPGTGGNGFDLRSRPDGQNDSKLTIERFTAGDAAMSAVVTISSAGSVGIGDTSPLQKLVVSGGNVGIGYNDVTQSAMLAVAGSVGIGTMTPSAGKLQFANEVGNKIVFWSGGPADTFGLGLGNSNVSVFVPAGGSFSLRRNGHAGTEYFKLDANGIQSGSANDYAKAQCTLSGGGLVTWGGPAGRLKWTARFIAIAQGKTDAIPAGHISIPMPVSDIPASQVYNGVARSVTADGVLLQGWEALYAVHTFGGTGSSITFRIHHYDTSFQAPSNWILVAVVNDDDDTVKLGTGAVVSSGSNLAHGSPVPRGVIVLWSGAANAIPAGWALCNGGSGTPDLRDRFVVGAGDSYAVGAAGGASTVTLSTNEMPAHGHGGDVVANGSHNHELPVDTGGGGIYGGDMLKTPDGLQQNVLANFLVYTGYNGYHDHGINIYNTGGNQAHENRPPYYALCYIMKL